MSDNGFRGEDFAFALDCAEEEEEAPGCIVEGTSPPLFENPFCPTPGDGLGGTPSPLFESCIFCLLFLQKASTNGSKDSQFVAASRFDVNLVPVIL